MAKIDLARISEHLRDLPGWQYEDNAIRKRYKFNEFMEGIRFVGAIAKIAERMDHHPDITINYTRLTFLCTTHSEGGVTEKDIKLAGEIEKAFQAAGRG
jgi:4a-hydroxytetrahydrobiopterin dehydratase